MDVRKFHIAGLSFFLILITGLFSQAQSISGNVHTEAGDNVENVTVTLTGLSVSTSALTGVDGNFSFNGLPDNQTYQLCLSRIDDPLNGVSSYDMVLLLQHIIHVTPLASPYQIIAADVRYDYDMPDVSDVFLIKQLTLNIITTMPAPSWKFIAADVTFGDPQDPFPDIPLPAGCKTINLNGNATGQDFIGIKTADLNGSAVAHN